MIPSNKRHAGLQGLPVETASVEIDNEQTVAANDNGMRWPLVPLPEECHRIAARRPNAKGDYS
jgi:hypothetical protein